MAMASLSKRNRAAWVYLSHTVVAVLILHHFPTVIFRQAKLNFIFHFHFCCGYYDVVRQEGDENPYGWT